MIPVPKLAEKLYPDYEKLVIAPPDGDLTNPECRAADMLVGQLEFMGVVTPHRCAFFQVEPEDIDRLRSNGGVIVLSLIGVVPPFDVHPL
jgi:hypothetical protein